MTQSFGKDDLTRLSAGLSSTVQRGEPVTLKLVRKYQFLDIIYFDNIQSTSLEKIDVVGLLSRKITSVEGSNSRLMYCVHQST